MYIHNSIKNKQELRNAYEYIRFLNSCKKGCYGDNIAENESLGVWIEEEIQNTKRDIRKCNKSHEADSDGRRVIKSDYDGFVELVELPLGIDSYDAADEYFKEYKYVHMTPSQYDCTGQLFTSWYKLFNRRGIWMAYHSIGIDV